MATTRIMPMHVGKGRAISEALSDIIEYAENPDKTGNRDFVSTYACNARLADIEFKAVKGLYDKRRRDVAGEKNVLAYQVRQSFKPGEITPEDANRIGYEMAMRFTKGKHQFVVATHIDKAHIHNHIIFNSTRIDGSKKFRNFKNSAKAVRRLNDTLCIENGLSVVEEPKKSGKDYGSWLESKGTRKPRSYRECLRQAIDAAMERQPQDFERFLREMKDAGYEIKRGKHIGFRGPGQQKFTRLRSLGDSYSEDALRRRIARSEPSQVSERHDAGTTAKPKESIRYLKPEVKLLLDLERVRKEKNSVGYERWAKKFNSKQMAATYIFLEKHKLLDYHALIQKTKSISDDYYRLADEIKAREKRLEDITELQRSISDYRRTKDVYDEYRRSKYSPEFYERNRAALERHKQARACFDAQGYGNNSGKKIPRMDALRQEYAALLAQKKKLYTEYYAVKNEMKEALNARANYETILNIGTHGKDAKAEAQNPTR